MEKLQPLITHRFWVLFGTTLLMSLIAWWLTAGPLSAATDQAITDIDSAFNKVPKGANLPNDSWAAGARELNAEKEAAVAKEKRGLWERQVPLMTWPAGIASKMKDLGYREDILGDERDVYRTLYPEARREVEAVLRPYDSFTGEGMVDISTVAMPFVDATTTWAVRPPSTEQMWDAQEDLWLAREIFKAIDDVNRKAVAESDARISESVIPQLKILELRGGSQANPLDFPESDASATDSGVPGAPGVPGIAMTNEGAGGRGFGGGQQGAAAGPLTPEVVFGDDTKQAEAAESGPNTGAPTINNEAIGLPGPGTSGGQNQARKRYVVDGDDVPFTTRGFYMQVVIQNQWLPELLLALRNSAWPTTVVYVQLASVHPEEAVPTGPGGVRPGGASAIAGTRPLLRPGPPALGGRPFNPGAIEGAGAGGNNQQGAGEGLLLALRNQSLVTVTIAGHMTIYKPVEAEEEDEASPTPTPTPTEPPSEGSPTEPGEPSTTNEETTEPGEPADDTETKPDDAGTDPADDDESDTGTEPEAPSTGPSTDTVDAVENN